MAPLWREKAHDRRLEITFSLQNTQLVCACKKIRKFEGHRLHENNFVHEAPILIVFAMTTSFLTV